MKKIVFSRALAKSVAAGMVGAGRKTFMKAALVSLLLMALPTLLWYGLDLTFDLLLPRFPGTYSTWLGPLRSVVLQLFSCAVMILLSPLWLGVARFYLRSAREHRAVEFSEIWYFYQNDRDRALRFGAGLRLRYFAIGLIPLAAQALPIALIALPPESQLSLALSVLFGLLTPVSLVLEIYLMLTYFFAEQIFADNPLMSPAEAFSLCGRMASKRRLEYFIFGMSFTPWILLSIFTVGIAAVYFVIPFYQLTLSMYYLSEKKRIARDAALPGGERAALLDNQPQRS